MQSKLRYSAEKSGDLQRSEDHTTTDAPRQEFQRRKLSRDEMNLAEFPLTVLSTRVDSTVKTLEFSDTVRGRNGELVQRQWIITGADKCGLPTSSDDEVLLGLVKLTVDKEFSSPRIEFTRYELLRALRWTTEGRRYDRLQRALDRLSGVRIKASNAFFDNESKSHSTRNFGIIDGYEINDGRENPKPSFFLWSDVLFKSFQVGFIKKLDLEFFLDLRSAVSKRLYRYLDKHFWYKSTWQINLFTLAHEKIGISRNYRHASSLKQQLDPAIEELIAHGFLKSANYVGRGRDSEVVFVSGRGIPHRVPGGGVPSGDREEAAQERESIDLSHAPHPEVAPAKIRSQSPIRLVQRGEAPLRASVESETHNELRSQRSSLEGRSSVRAHLQSGQGRSAEDSRAFDLREHLIGLLVERGLKHYQATQLIAPHGADGLERIGRIVEHVDQLRATGSSRISRSPVGFLYRAVEHPYSFALPGDPGQGQPRQTSMPLSTGRVSTDRTARQSSVRVPQTHASPPGSSNASVVGRSSASSVGRSSASARTTGPDREGKIQGDWLVARHATVERLRKTTPAATLGKLTLEVEQALRNMRSIISPQAFQETVAHGVGERLLQIAKFPTLEEWAQGKL
jgi:hypothetical protein